MDHEVWYFINFTASIKSFYSVCCLGFSSDTV